MLLTIAAPTTSDANGFSQQEKSQSFCCLRHQTALAQGAKANNRRRRLDEKRNAVFNQSADLSTYPRKISVRTTRATAQALALYQKAAHKANVQGPLGVANIYYQGPGAPQDLSHAATLYLDLGRMGVSVAQRRLGAMYELRQGFPKDMVIACAWYAIVAAPKLANPALEDLVARTISPAAFAKLKKMRRFRRSRTRRTWIAFQDCLRQSNLTAHAGQHWPGNKEASLTAIWRTNNCVTAIEWRIAGKWQRI